MRLIHPDRLTPGSLWRAIQAALAQPAPAAQRLAGGAVAAGRAERLLQSGGLT